MNSLTSLDTLIAIAALIGAGIGIAIWARHCAKATPQKAGSDEEPKNAAEEPATQFLVLPPSQYPAHLSALAIVPLHDDERAHG